LEEYYILAQLAMKFCKVCERAMPREIGSGSVVFVCACGAEEKGTAMDARIGGQSYGTSETRSMYSYMLATASKDRTNQLVPRDCPNCGLDYMVQARVGSAEVIVYSCKCGYSPGAD
jgi:predicted RNA-binding Zn-ribbon protein involved in translation (DUF1610 family)